MVLTILAVIPGIVLFSLVYGLDRNEKEPMGLMWKLFCLGAISVIPAAIVELILKNVYQSTFAFNNIVYFIALCYFAIGLAEEGGKYFFLKMATWKSPEFNYTFDGVVYAVTVSLGFAVIENIMYVLSTRSFGVAIMRALLSVPGHAMFGVYMGTYYGIAKLSESYINTAGRDKNLFRAYAVAVFIHGTYDFCLMTGQVVIVIPFLIFEIWFTIHTYKKLKLLAGADRRIQ